MFKKASLAIPLVSFMVVFVTFGIITAAKADHSTIPAYPPPASNTYQLSPSAYSSPSFDLSDTQASTTQKTSDSAQVALTWVAENNNLSTEVLEVVDDHLTEYPKLGRRFQVVTILDTRSQGDVYKLLVDPQNGQVYEDISVLTMVENSALISQYGNLQPFLYNRLQSLNDDDIVPVAIWLLPTTEDTLADIQETILLALTTKYPEAQDDVPPVVGPVGKW